MTADEHGEPDQNWTVKLRLAIDAGNAQEARAAAEEVLRKMDVTAGAEPQVTQSAGRREPYWNVITELDLSGVEPVTPDDAPTRFMYVARRLPGITWTSPAVDKRHGGLWQWLPESWQLMASEHQELAHPAVRAAGILISAR